MGDRQKIFDTVAAHLLKQNKKSVGADNLGHVCQYRSSDGLKWAIGCLITDEAYYPNLENKPSVAPTNAASSNF